MLQLGRYGQILLIGIFSLLLFALSLKSRNQFCINSTVVNKIDAKFITQNEQDKILSCKFAENPRKYSVYFSDKLDSLNTRMSKFEAIVSEFGFKIQPVEIVILPDKTETFEREYDTSFSKKIKISEDILAGSYLEKALFYNVVLHNLEKLPDYQKLSIEKSALVDVVADLLFFVYSNEELDIKKYLVNKPSYNLISKYKKLSILEKYKFEKYYLQSDIWSSLDLKNTVFDISFIKYQKHILTSPQVMKNIPEFSKERTGDKEKSVKAEIAKNELFETLPVKIKDKKLIETPIKGLTELSKTNVAIEVSFISDNYIWHLPANRGIKKIDTGLSTHIIKTNLLVVEGCKETKVDELFQFQKFSDNILIVKNCLNSEVNYAGIFNKSIEIFSEDNPGISFVKIHLPSLKMKHDQLAKIADIFNILSSKDSVLKTAQIFGWQGVDLNSITKLHKPIAYIDAIQAYQLTQE